MLPTIRYTKIGFVKKFLAFESRKEGPRYDSRLQNPTDVSCKRSHPPPRVSQEPWQSKVISLRLRGLSARALDQRFVGISARWAYRPAKTEHLAIPLFFRTSEELRNRFFWG
jgi:hypothetical protein